MFAGGFGLAVLSRGDDRSVATNVPTADAQRSESSETDLPHPVPAGDAFRLIGLQEYDLPNGSPYASTTFDSTGPNGLRQVVRITTARPFQPHFAALDLATFHIAVPWTDCLPSQTVNVHGEWHGWMWRRGSDAYVRVEWNVVTSARVVVETWGLDYRDSLTLVGELEYLPPRDWASIRESLPPQAVVSDAVARSANWLLVDFADPPAPAAGALIEADDSESLGYLIRLTAGDIDPRSSDFDAACAANPVAP